ncbi:hypothetical protein K2Q16_03055 [Patescibacteria group bacterium]|nr:hypothetical protein [Patescibacteria group bacterium]
MIVRLLSLALIIMGALFFPWWAVALMTIPYTTRYTGYELIAVAVLIDAFYGVFSRVPWLTLCVVVIVLLMMFIRPRLRTPEMVI